MTRRPQAIFSLIALLSLFGAAPGCVTDKVTGQKRLAVVQWSPEEEVEIGRKSVPQLTSYYQGVVPDREAQEYLRSVVLEMTTHSVRSADFDFTFQVLNSSEMNAFALPGGFVFVTRGLLQNLETEAQFVSVLGHELGHVEHQHSMLNQTGGAFTNIIAAPFRILQAPLGEGGILSNAVGLAGSLATAAPALLSLKFSRDQELQADVRGVFFADSMGYDPRDADEVYRLFARLEEESGSDTPGFLRTHPVNEARIEKINETIRNDYPEVLSKKDGDFRKSEDRFKNILRGLEATAPSFEKYQKAKGIMQPGKELSKEELEKAKGLLTEAHQEVPTEPLFSIALAEVLFYSEEHEQIRPLLEQAVASYDAYDPEQSYWLPHFYLGILSLAEGDSDHAVRQLEKASTRLPDQPLVIFILATAQEQSGDKRGARKSYEMALDMTPRSSEINQAARERLAALGG